MTSVEASVFRFRLYSDDWDELGEFESAVPDWSAGDVFLTGDGRRFRIVGIAPVHRRPRCVQRLLEGRAGY
jgi:hypothetical protein